MAKTIQIRVDDEMKNAVDELFAGLGLDTSTAVKMFFRAAVKAGRMPFAVKRKRKRPNAELLEAVEDVRLKRNLYGPFDTAAEAIASMLEDD